jgi:hypothetical protein
MKEKAKFCSLIQPFTINHTHIPLKEQEKSLRRSFSLSKEAKVCEARKLEQAIKSRSAETGKDVCRQVLDETEQKRKNRF